MPNGTLVFPLIPWVHDPSGQPMDYTIQLQLDADDTLSSVTVTPVDDNDTPLSGDSLQITNVEPGALGNGLWGVTFDAQSGTVGMMYKLRVRWTLSDGRGSDTTVRLRCANT